MAKIDRYFEIIQRLRNAGGVITAAQLADDLEVSERTIYRDIAALQAMRIPIDGEAGIGYVIRPGYDLPPVNFDDEEIEAIIVGLGLLSRTGDTGLQSAARRVMTKLEAASGGDHPLRVSDWGIASPIDDALQIIRTAIREERKIAFTYRSLTGEETTRRVKPFAITYYIEVVVLGAWCELRTDIRNFRIDRICNLELLEDTFTGEGHTLRMLAVNEGPVIARQFAAGESGRNGI